MCARHTSPQLEYSARLGAVLVRATLAAISTIATGLAAATHLTTTATALAAFDATAAIAAALAVGSARTHEHHQSAPGGTHRSHD